MTIGIGYCIPNRKPGINWSSYWTPLYIRRVNDDGGSMIDSQKVDNDFHMLEEVDEMDSLVMGVTGYGGIKITDNNGLISVDKLYNYVGTNDPAQADASKKPILSIYNIIESIYFGYPAPLDPKSLDHAPILTNDYTAVYVYQNIGTPVLQYIHAGAVDSNKLGIIAQGKDHGFGVYANIAGGRLNATVENNDIKIAIATPLHLYIDGVECSYASGFTANVNVGELTRIGDRPDVSRRFKGLVSAIFIFNKTLSDEKRQIIESYFGTNISTYKKELTNYEQLAYQIYHQTGDTIFGGSIANGNLIYSENGGSSFISLAFADIAKVQMGYIFDNGTLFFCTDTKVYKSTDGLLNISEITPLDELGNNYLPALGKDNFTNISPIYSKDTASGQMIVWGNYGGADVYAIWTSIDGNDCKMVYRFGAGYDYSCTHIHCVSYISTDNAWYCATGDTAGLTHWMRGEYNELEDTWAWERIIEGDDNDQTKSLSIQEKDSYIYWLSDQTDGTDKLGIWHCLPANISNIANHVRDLAVDIELNNMIMEDSRIIFTGILHAYESWCIYVFDRAKKTVDQYFFTATPEYDVSSRYEKQILRLRKIASGEYLIDIMDLTDGFIYNTIRFFI